MDPLQAVAEPRRREILRLIWSDELSVGEIAARFEVTRPAISQHLRVLRETGLVSERRDGTRRLYRAIPETLGDLRVYLEAYWDDTLRALKRAAEQAEGRQQRGKRERRHERH